MRTIKESGVGVDKKKAKEENTNQNYKRPFFGNCQVEKWKQLLRNVMKAGNLEVFFFALVLFSFGEKGRWNCLYFVESF